MLRSIVQSSLKSRFVVIVLAAAFLVVGVGRLRDMPVDVLPEFSLPYVEIQTEALGLSAEEVEQLVTLGMEQDLLNGVPWVQSIRSESLPGLSSVVIVFKPGTDLMRARQMVSERMTQAYALPHVSKPPIMMQPRSATSRVLIVGLSSKTLSPIQMSVLARWTIMPRLKGIPGVANVAIWGQRDRQLQVRVDPMKLSDHKVSLLSILETTGNALWWSTLSFVEASTPGSGGFIDTHNQRLGVRHIFPIVSPRDLAEVPIEDTPYKLSDVATIAEDHQPLIGDALTKDGQGLLLVVEKFPGANTLDVTEDVEDALHELLPGMQGMEVNTHVYRPADFIESMLKNARMTALAALALLALLLALFFFDLRAALIGCIAAPLSFIAAGFVLDLTGATMNAIVLTGFAIAAAIVVYHSIMDVENVMRCLRENREAGSPESATRVLMRAILETRGSVLYGTLMLLLAVAPILWMGGTAGAFFRPLAISYALALLASMVVGWTVTPALCVILLSNAALERRSSPLVAGLQRMYDAILSGMVRQGRAATVVTILLTVAAVVITPRLHRTVLPVFKERDLVIDLRALPGTSLPEMTRVGDAVRRELQSVPGVRDVSAHIGRAVLGDQAVDVHSAQLWLSMDHAANYDKTAAAIQHVVDGYPGISHRVQTYLREKSEDVVPGAEDKVITRVYGETEAGLREHAEQVRKAVAEVKGVVAARVLLPQREAAVEVQVDVPAAQRHGLKPGDVRRAAATLVSGIVVGNLYEAQKVFEVVVWSTPETRHDPSSVRNLLIDTPDGGHVRLGDVAQVRVVPASSVQRHDSCKRYLDVAADVEGRDLGAVAGDIDKRIAQLQFPLEYHAEVQGGYAESGAAARRMMWIGLAAAIGIYILFQAAFGSWRLAGLALVTLPAALAGGVLAAAATGGALTIGSFAGLLAVLGIALCNKLVMIRRYQDLERYEGEAFGAEMVLRGSRERMSPVLMATLAAAVMMVPALLMGDAAGLEILRPMTIVVLGGLITTGALDLFLLPALFLGLGVSSVHEVDPVLESARGELFAVPAPAGSAGD
jgi:CzcA family heavy metal efflux pump